MIQQTTTPREDKMIQQTTTSPREHAPMDSAHKSLLCTSEAIALLALGLAIGLEYFVPLPLAGLVWSPALWLTGGALSAVGVLCVLSAKAKFK